MMRGLAFVMIGFTSVTAGAQSDSIATAPLTHPAFLKGNETPLGHTVAAVLAEPEVARAHVGVAVVGMNGTPIFGLNEGQLFRPASNAKLFTTAAAMQRLRPTAVARTFVESAEKPVDGVLHGDLSIECAGDANLSGRHLPYEAPAEHSARLKAGGVDNPLAAIDALAADVVSQGVRHITGSIVGSVPGFNEPYPLGWGIDDQVWGYGAPVSLAAVDDNQIEVRVMPGAKVGDLVRVTLSPDIGELQLKIEATTSPKGTKGGVQFEREPGSQIVRIFGTMALDSSPDDENLAVVDPERFAAEALRASLIAHGVQVDGPASGKHQPLQDARSFREAASRSVTPPKFERGEAMGDGYSGIHIEHNSGPLAEDIKVTLKVSQNLHAEIMLRRMGWELSLDEDKQSERSWAIEGVRAVRATLLADGLDGDDFVFFDGSGLSDKDLVTPRATTSLLTYAAKQPWFAQWKDALPVGGVDGSLSGHFKDGPLKGHVFAKTGTLGESRALSGYVDCASGKTVAFAIFVDTHLPGHSEGNVIDKIVAAIAANN